MERETKVVPDLYFPGEGQELQVSNAEGEGEQGEEGGLEGGDAVDLTPEGFIPIHTLTLGDLPEPIRSEGNLKAILDFSKNVVRVNNNGLSCRRPDDDEFKRRKQRTLCGSGFLQILDGNNVQITTNNHVLFNEEELKVSTFDVFFDYHHGDPEDKKELFDRCARTNGKFFFGKYSKEDLAVACFKVNDAMAALIKEHCCDKAAIQQHYDSALQLDLTIELNVAAPIVCLISHPLGQPKHVSFGEMLDYDMQSRIIHHTAPSKPGSSGGPVIIFSKSCFFDRFSACHVGTDSRNGNKYATMHSHVFSLSDALGDFGELESGYENNSTTFEEYAQTASESLEMAVLTAFAPVFGAFLLHAEETRLEGLDTSSLKPCKTFVTDDHLTSRDLKQSVNEVVAKLAQVAPSFTVCPSNNLDDGSDLVCLLESQGPCFCQSIVEMMGKGVKSEDGVVTECFLSPYSASTIMSTESDTTWPWMNRSNSESRNEVGVDDCLMKKCLELCEKNIIFVILLLMITKANHCVKQLFAQSCAVPTTMTSGEVKGEWKILYQSTEQVRPCEESPEQQPGSRSKFPPLSSEKKLNSSSADMERDWNGLTGDVLSVMKLFMKYMSPLCPRTLIHNRDYQRVIPQQADTDEDTCLYSRCLALSEHAWQHELQTHPDTERVGREHSIGNWCRCGRPAVTDVISAFRALREPEHTEKTRESQHKRTKRWDDKDLLPNSTTDMREQFIVHFLLLLRGLQKIASEKSLPPETFILTVLDRMEAFPRGRHSLMLFMATREALLYNLCLLLKHISKHLQPRYFAFPVSVYGRPGNWPGNVTPPEVQRTAWRLIQDAIMASGFPPAVLSALEKDADRREKLIDLYVDMKQLKWDRRIHPHLFAEYRAISKRALVDFSQGIGLLFDSTHYFVWYAAFLVCPKLVFSRSYISQPHSVK